MHLFGRDQKRSLCIRNRIIRICKFAFILRSDVSSSSNDSTQPKHVVLSIENFEVVVDSPNNTNGNFYGIIDVHVMMVQCCFNDMVICDILEPPGKKCGCGGAKNTEFEKLQKYGKISFKINEGKTSHCCENCIMFTTRVTWILKHHSNLCHISWHDVHENE